MCSVGFQTFGVITMRLDILDGGGGSSVARASASTMSNSSSSAAGLVPPCPKPLQPGTEQEIHNLLIIDDHTFEGILIFCIMFYSSG